VRRKFRVKFGRVFLDMREDRQIYRHADRNTSRPFRGEVIKFLYCTVQDAACAAVRVRRRLTVYDEERCGDDVGDEITSDTFIQAGVVLVQVNNRQVPDFLQRSCRRREFAVNLKFTNPSVPSVPTGVRAMN